MHAISAAHTTISRPGRHARHPADEEPAPEACFSTHLYREHNLIGRRPKKSA
jgi:hypothetical protein